MIKAPFITNGAFLWVDKLGFIVLLHWRGSALASPFGRGAPVRTLGRRGPSQSKIGSEVPIFASSPKGGAK